MGVHIDGELSRWLLDGDPAIRWQTMRDLLDAPLEDVKAERAQVARSGWGQQLLARQDPEGTWAGGLYSPKWVSTTYTLLLLMRCGLIPTGAMAEAVKLLWDGATYTAGGLTCAKSISAPEACVTSMYVSLARYFGFEDERVDAAVEWLLTNQLDDGGWNCRTVRSGDRHSSFHTSISALEALAEDARCRPDSFDVHAAMEVGREFFLAHRMYKSHRTGAVADQAFTMLSFPPRWHYDVLRGLDYLQSMNAPWDERLADAIELLRSKRRRDGKWPVQRKHSGRVWFDMETGRHPSRWNTLRALRVMNWVESVRPQSP